MPAAVSGISSVDGKFRWKNGIVPFEVDADLPDPKRVADAIAHWRSKAPILSLRSVTQPRRITITTSGLRRRTAAGHRSECEAACRLSRCIRIADSARRSTRSDTPLGCGMNRAERTVRSSSALSEKIRQVGNTTSTNTSSTVTTWVATTMNPSCTTRHGVVKKPAGDY